MSTESNSSEGFLYDDFSRFAAGLWRLAESGMNTPQLQEFINQCLETGITTFDHADIYGDYSCEELFGKAISGKTALRQQMQLVTKCGIKLVSRRRPEYKLHSYDTGKAHILQSVENSLRSLNTDYIDVLLIHRPDPLMNPDEIAEAFTLLRENGKVLNFGVSNFLPSQFDLLQSRLSFPLITNQVEISVMCYDAIHNGVLDQCSLKRIRPMAWSPLAGGRLFYSEEPQAQRLRHVLNEISNESAGYSHEQIALAWLLKHPAGILPVLGSGKIDRIKSAIASTEINLSHEHWFAIFTAAMGNDIP